ncbi:hypothetical protein ACPWT1_06705 [Ramlibacter sp. MMS24-I3-19]|uniref:hypothetical protein n=1 Tax=Ramlibacter sp. MMS24-I3-19 TaxID=3416606 RepID=UPI003D04567A
MAAEWHAFTGCELRYVRGPIALAGMVSAYGGQRLLVLEDGDSAKSPWINLEAMRVSGFVDMRDEPRRNPTGFQTLVRLPGTTPMQFVVEVHPPQEPCPAR